MIYNDENKDVRWHQRLQNYEKAVGELTEFLEKQELNKFEEQGLIQCFEYTYELAWNVMKDYFEFQGEEGIGGSRDSIKLAFKRKLIIDGDNWMEMIKSRINSTHSYNRQIAIIINQKVRTIYYDLFVQFLEKMKEIKTLEMNS